MALSDGLVGYWSPWLGSSGYRLLDRARSNHGTLTNMDAGTDWVGATIQGRSGYALDFDGTNDYVTTSMSLASKTQVGISLWYWRSSSAHAFYCGAGLGGSGGPRANIYLFGGTLYMTAETTGVNAFLSTSVGTTGWMHIFYRYNGNAASQSVRLLPYVNGNLLSFGSAGIFPTSLGNVGNFEIGRTLGENAYGTGRVAESCLWFRDLQESEIRELYRIGPGWYRPYAKRSIGYAALAGFKAYWHRRQQQIIGGGLR